MFLESAHNFRVRRRIPRGLTQSVLLGANSNICIGDIVATVRAKLNDLAVVSGKRINFTLIGVHSTLHGYGYMRYNVAIPNTVARFVFVLNKNIEKLPPITEILTRNIGFRTKLSRLKSNSQSDYQVLTIGLSRDELGVSGNYFRGNMSELKLLYNAVGANTKAAAMGKVKSYEELENYKQFLLMNPREMLANYPPYYWLFNLGMWKTYPQFLPELDPFAALFYFIYIHNDVKRSNSSELSGAQGVRLGRTLKYGDNSNSLINILQRSVVNILVDEDGEFSLNRKAVNASNPVFLASFGDFWENLNSYYVARTTAFDIVSDSSSDNIKQNLFNLIWSR